MRLLVPLCGASVALAAACGAPPMTLTKALFAAGERQPGVIEGHYVCDIQAVRGRLDRAPSARTLAVDVAFHAASDQGLPAHLQAYGSSASGTDTLSATFALAPAVTRLRWPEDFASDATRGELALRFHDARYFRDGSPAAEVTFTGTVGRAAVGQLVGRAQVSAGIASLPAWQATGIPGGLAPVLRAARRHPLARIAGISGDTPPRRDPIAWLGPQDQVLSHEDVLLLLQPWREIELGRRPPAGLAAEDCALLLRFVHGNGRIDYLTVPLALLREGDDLALVCDGDDDAVTWIRREIWRGRIQPEPGTTAEWPDPGLRLAHTRVPYGFDELARPSAFPMALVRALVAPLAWSLDILGWSNPVIQRGLEALVGKPPPQQPFTPVRSDR